MWPTAFNAPDFVLQRKHLTCCLLGCQDSVDNLVIAVEPIFLNFRQVRFDSKSIHWSQVWPINNPLQRWRASCLQNVRWLHCYQVSRWKGPWNWEAPSSANLNKSLAGGSAFVKYCFFIKCRLPKCDFITVPSLDRFSTIEPTSITFCPRLGTTSNYFSSEQNTILQNGHVPFTSLNLG